jgi:tRNA-splicing ligase RtcB
MSGFDYIEGEGAPIKAWTRSVPIEDAAMAQLRNVAALPFIYKHVAVMPDVHWGMGATVGSVIPTLRAIIPAAVGVDIGCGMMAVRTSVRAEHLPDSLAAIRCDIEAAVPHGRTDNGGRNDVGAWQAEPPASAAAKWAALQAGYAVVVNKHPKAARPRGLGHLGTLGTGYHFIELCLDETGAVWVMLHSGSRGVGNRFGSYFIERAKHEMRRWFINLPDQDLAYFPEGSEGFGDYFKAVSWAQRYALANREVMMGEVLGALRKHLPDLAATETAVNCHHNYVTREHHFGKDVYVTRKGAVRAGEGELGIIPGSMGAGRSSCAARETGNRS